MSLLNIGVSCCCCLVLISCHYYQPISTSIGFAVVGYQLVDHLIPSTSQHFIKRGLHGKDLSKLNKPIIPETIGIIPSIVYIFILIIIIPFIFRNDSSTSFNINKLGLYLSCLLSLLCMIILGLIDDLFDIRWRHKFFLPFIASIPLLVVYYIDYSLTSILIPKFITQIWGSDSNSIDLGWVYYIYMGSISIFCPNSINILAGINGLEVGQTIIIGLLLLINDFYYLSIGNSTDLSYNIHSFSSCLLIPFMGVALSLFKYNKYPSKVFVGDTWCYFSGMVFAVVGISGHFAKTLMLFFIPQLFNFIYSIPQLFGLIPCPRHRLPKFNELDGLLYNSYTEYDKKPLKKCYYKIFTLLEKFKLIKLVKKDDLIVKSSNLTLINLILIWTGPVREDQLCYTIMLLQFLIGFIMLILRHTIVPILFGFDNSWNMLNRH
ncbi:hypothetical protein CANARDRAFT_200790 [[Candida] arabinofermentans NRRL YB-2248]|uniref:UDP-N-acetylglucosamine--dolichyl-phosphate N-acetylglucosaminephosphotransferase n=1 Tax=[Candida] arabinofermentans NRRL YB-2248 TaxID=983967 RepID=A0A1E4SYC1_9ASCO|nr:hypothetical protein CANARDRAFT_200790 [[Candida] arabinofermentans NRRL YB-2248]